VHENIAWPGVIAGLAQTVDDLDGDDGIAAELEEVVMSADALYTQQA